jgi:hypothetical protein
VATIRHKRLHPAMGWGALLIIVSFQGIFCAVQTEAWIKTVTRAFS